MSTSDSAHASIPPIIHLVNFAALFVIGVILLLAGVANTRSLIILLPVMGLAVAY
jgi:hypothetical protein